MTLRSIVICALAAIPLVGCGLHGHDEMELYARRSDLVTMDAGNAKEVNARTHMLTPWPVYVGDRRIPMEGSRGVRAVECYRSGGSSTAQSGSGGGSPVQVNINNAPGSGSSGSAQPKC